MVALRSPRPTAPAAAPVEPVAAPVTPPDTPLQPDAPMLDTLKEARDSIPFPPGQAAPDVSALQQQIAAQKQAEQAQQRAFEAQRQIAAAMAIEREKPKEPPQLSEKDLEWLGARPNVQSDPGFNQAVQALAHVYQYGSPAFYEAMSLRYPVSDFRRVEPKHHDDTPSAIVEREEPKQRRVVTSAPVSRNGQPSGDYTPGPSSVKLTAEERHFAAQSGVSEAEYARNKLRLAKLKGDGFYRDK